MIIKFNTPIMWGVYSKMQGSWACSRATTHLFGSKKEADKQIKYWDSPYMDYISLPYITPIDLIVSEVEE